MVGVHSLLVNNDNDNLSDDNNNNNGEEEEEEVKTSFSTVKRTRIRGCRSQGCRNIKEIIAVI